MSPNIIAFSGTHGTGKTTQAYKLASQLKLKGKSVVVLDEVARECPFPINKESTDITQYWILSTQIRREMKLMSRYDHVITDRSIFDTIAYGILLESLNASFIDSYKSYVKKYYKQILVLNPDTFNFQIMDGVRDMDKIFREQVHNTILHTYSEGGVEFKLINSKEELDDYQV